MLSKYGVARHVYIPIVKRGVVDFAVGADWSPAAGDVKISKDGGAFANVTNLPTVLASANTGAVWLFALTATEMQAAYVVVVVSDAATKAIEDQSFIIETYGHASAQHEFDLDTPTVAASSIEAGGITAASFDTGAIDAAAIAADAIGASGLATDAVTEIVTAVWAKTATDLAAIPGATAALSDVLSLLFMLARNKRIQSTTTETLYKDNSATVVGTSAKTDDGSTFTRGKYS